MYEYLNVIMSLEIALPFIFFVLIFQLIFSYNFDLIKIHSNKFHQSNSSWIRNEIKIESLVSVGMEWLFDKQWEESIDLEINQERLSFLFIVWNLLSILVQELAYLIIEFNLDMFQLLRKWPCASFCVIILQVECDSFAYTNVEITLLCRLRIGKFHNGSSRI